MESNTKHKKTFKSESIERVSEESIPWYSKRLFKEHEKRYLFAKKFVKNKVALDIACGNGYGSQILAYAGAKFVYGIDNNKEAIDFANKHYLQRNIKFILGNAEKINLKEKSVDIIISFETIEHLRYPKRFLKESKRILKPNGILILSTPNKEVSYEDNPFHLNEYTLSELDVLFSDFSGKTYYGQRPVFKKVVYFYKYIYRNISSIPFLSPVKFFLRFRPWENQKILKIKNLSDTGYMYIIAVCRKLTTAHSDYYFCTACGENSGKWIFKKIISKDLAKAWKLSNELRRKFNLRESQFCPNCENSARTRILAGAIMDAFPIDGVKNLKDWVQKSQHLKISVAEINSCGKLHKFLTKIPNLSYSEYPPQRILPKIYFFIKRVRKEDITSLSYPDKSFDLVLHSEVLEHVPDVDKAISECRRILNPKGICLFTTPLIPKRYTKQCSVIDKKTGEILHLKTPSFHGLDDRADNMVWWEFGHDFLTKYKLKMVNTDPKLMAYVFLMRKI